MFFYDLSLWYMSGHKVPMLGPVVFALYIKILVEGCMIDKFDAQIDWWG